MFKTLRQSVTVKAAVLCCFYLAAGALSTSQLLSQITQISGGQTRIITNQQTAVAYTVPVSDCGKLLSLSNASGMTVTIPQAGTDGLPNGCWIDIQNTGAGTVILTPTGSLIDGATTISLTNNQGLRLVSNGAAYFTQRGQGQGQGSSGGGSGNGDSLTIQSGGVALGAASTLNVVAGTGVSCVPQVNGGVMTFQCNADTSYLTTKTTLQGAANPQLCVSSSGSGATFTASCASALTAYVTMQNLFWYADVTNTSTTPTLNIDTLGAKSLVKQDGSALAVNDIKASTLYRIWYDGSNLHVVEAGLGGGSSSSSNSSSSPLNNYWVGTGYVLPAASTTYFTPGIGGTSIYGTPMTTEAFSQLPINSARTGKNMCLSLYGVQDASGSLVLTLRDTATYGAAGTSTALSIVVPAGGGTSGAVTKWCDTTHSISISPGHAVSIQVINSATTAGVQPLVFTVEI